MLNDTEKWFAPEIKKNLLFSDYTQVLYAVIVTKYSLSFTQD